MWKMQISRHPRRISGLRDAAQPEPGNGILSGSSSVLFHPPGLVFETKFFPLGRFSMKSKAAATLIRGGRFNPDRDSSPSS